MKKHVALSNKSLDKVWGWCEENKGTPLSTAYLDACAVVGGLDCSKICDQLRPTWKGGVASVFDEAYKPYELAFIYRDTVGRMILDLIKRSVL